MDERPAWLSAMEHGVLGEARARAFLLDRFWVLKRSVDIEGADLLIQLRDTRLGVFDSASPRVGLVQVKFIQDTNTAITIPAAYVRDGAGDAHNEFFLIVCTGSEDSERLFLLSASDICEGFDETQGTGDSCFGSPEASFFAARTSKSRPRAWHSIGLNTLFGAEVSSATEGIYVN
jgi:hypothetical protein